MILSIQLPFTVFLQVGLTSSRKVMGQYVNLSLIHIYADNVGAACRTDVLNKTPKTLAIREVLSNRFGVGNSTFRLGVDKVMDCLLYTSFYRINIFGTLYYKKIYFEGRG